MSAKKDNWRFFFDISKTLATISIPVIVAIIGIEANKNIKVLETTMKNVTAMAPFFDMITDTLPGRSRLGGYALYMLNENDPCMAVSLLLASGNTELNTVVKELARIDSNINHCLVKIFNSSSDTSRTLVEQNALEAYNTKPNSSLRIDSPESNRPKLKYSGLWVYIGQFPNDPLIKGSMKNNIPIEGETYELLLDVKLRNAKPLPSNAYKGGTVKGVGFNSDKIIIKEFTLDKKNYAWAKVDVLAK